MAGERRIAAPAWTGVVLAGGHSSRMGRDKAYLDWHGRPLIEHMQALLTAAGAGRVLLSGPYPEYGAVADVADELGPVGGLISIAATAPDGVLLIVPVDMPRLSPPLLRNLVAAPEAACACYAGHILPLRLRLDKGSRGMLDGLRSAPRSGRSLRALHAALAGIEVAPAGHADGELDNCNTPEQWQEISR
ncbi:molybdenum cofactor guanylyltransferase [Pseudoxanthomonas wuyuanensis]